MSENPYAIKAIPTRYKGIQMRSRLEARWAAFFDLMHWPWEYEPFDLDGWVPDFVVGGSHGKTLVEVKPLDWDNTSWADPCFGVFEKEINHAKKLSRNYNGLLVLGLKPRFGQTKPYDSNYISPCWYPGAHWQNKVDKGFWDFTNAAKNKETGIYDCATSSGPDIYPGMITGEDYNFLLDHIDYFPGLSEGKIAWAEAGNMVQWKPPR